MAFTTDEKTALAAHLRFLRALRPDQWIEDSDIDALLDGATDAQQIAARADLPTLDRLRLDLSKINSRFAVVEIVGELKFRDNEFSLRAELYGSFLLQLGLLLGCATTPSGTAIVSSLPKRGW